MTSLVNKETIMSKAVIIPECNKDIGGIKEEISLSPPEKRDGAIGGLFSRLLRLDTLSKKSNAPESPTSMEPPTTYYGVYIPSEIKKGPDEEALHVYKNKSEALELVRRYKASRFKAFRNRQDAVSFALRGAEPTDTTDGNDSLMGEKPYPFKAPSPQDMVALRKAIEAGLSTTVRDRVWDNPRFLVSSGNTPAIMQEGSRYNALHIAAKAMNAEICNLILTTVGNPMFVQTLYGMDADADSCKEFASILVDRYLNTPDKAINETPLHFAAKFGAEQVVDVLTSFPQCNRSAVNKYGEQAKDIICKRATNSSPGVPARIAAMLRERYYVPVLHSEDGSAVPTIGKAFTPAVPPEINRDPLSPRYEIRAYAGPMEARDAELFRRRWKTPPRAPAQGCAPGPAAPLMPHANYTTHTPAPPASPKPQAFRLKEITKGLETVGRELAEEMKVGWKEYWPFLDTFTDLRTPEGLTLLENYLKNKYESACSFAYSDSCAHSRVPEDLSLSRISLSMSQLSPSRDSTLSPMSELCVAMKSCKISNERPPHWRKTDPLRQRLCRQPGAKIVNGDAPTMNHTVSQLLCIERTCQVFAKRIADALTFSLTAEPETAGDSLKSESKHLQHTIFTYMDDERFKNIDFALIHSRLAQLVVYKLKQQTTELDDINHLLEFLVKLRCPNDDIFSSDDERKVPSYRCPSRVRMTHVIDSHVRCLASFICEELTEGEILKAPAMSETECTELWQKASKCRCDWKIEVFERNSKKNASFRKNRSILSTSPKSESFIRRLTFDHDIGDCAEQNSEAEQPVSVNSPAGDSGAALYTLDTAKCHVVHAEISDDESGASLNSEEEFHTASEHSDLEEDDMAEASDCAKAEPFIYGEEPSKVDRLVFDALYQCQICPEQYPHVYRWRHSVALYPPEQRDKWQPAQTEDSMNVSISLGGFSPAPPAPRPRATCSTPQRERDTARAPPLQVSTWLRVTGPNSPRSALAVKNANHNVSFGF
ncbi:ankyrin repeat and LEM domain-containing protein 2 homolog isoform X2 [Helicoverpa zea]|uniref:ankyrin repeat and LEM domain-containing protein 2 homolog isoform X2 n=1 Tax=Helicoverpa zea TaxID=7113 RepID=UPI001F57CCA0|nr:ankyrin repeat and LEM domain-containing protein 2 homolog isoform X2 [Helicoverpa zea]